MGRKKPGSGTFRILPIGAILALTGLIVVSAYFGRAASGHPISLREALLATLDWYIWLAFLPLVLGIARRASVARLGWRRWLFVHAPLALGVALVELWVYSRVARFAHGPSDAFASMASYYYYILASWLPYALLFYWVIVLGRELLHSWADRQRGQVESAELREELVRAQLGALRMQLHPHFMANTLHTVGINLREGETDLATRMVERLGELFNRSLEGLRRQEVALADEIDFARGYLEIEQMRFSDRLSVVIDIDPSVERVPVPSMILQPLIENAIRYTVQAEVKPTIVELTANRCGDALEIFVRDNGPGFAAMGAGNGRGLGIANARERIARLYGDDGSLHLADRVSGGAEVRLRVPIRRREIA